MHFFADRPLFDYQAWRNPQGLSFDELALACFQHQAEFNPVYKEFIGLLGLRPSKIQGLHQIPFLPVELFKGHRVVTGSFEPEAVFASSGTTGSIPSKRHVQSLDWYRRCFSAIFKESYGDPQQWCILALLPGYIERGDSSLIYMVNDLMKQGRHPLSNFYLNNHAELKQALRELKLRKQKTMLIGVSHALLDFAEELDEPFPDLLVMETGGMKGRRKEVVRDELHRMLCEAFGVPSVHSEYGMTELLSQAYSKGQGRFFAPPWMRVIIRDTDDPFAATPQAKTGRIHVVDLANVDTCAFIATGDLGRTFEDGSFEVLGRFDHAEVRGCNLMVAD